MKKLINILLVFVVSTNVSVCSQSNTQPLIIISAQGDAQHEGRRIGSGCERNESHLFAQKLGKKLRKINNIYVLLSHEPTDIVDEFRLISLANNASPCLYIKIYIAYEPVTKPNIALFYLSYNPLKELGYRPPQLPYFIPISRSHLPALSHTLTLVECVKKNLNKPKNQKTFSVTGPWGIPLKPLRGILAPALSIELTINSPNQWKPLVSPIYKSLLGSL